MKLSQRSLAFTTLVAVSLGGLNVSAHGAPAVGPMGKSAKEAARLKVNPAPSWLAHYLPDDRYKIAGGVWKYVSTDLDTYVHLPNSPLMLRQSADSVIGFASLKDAEEAGYTPEAGISSFEGMGGGPAMPSANLFKTPQKITLSDGKSTIVIPAMWMKFKSMVMPMRGGNVTFDIFVGPKKALISVSTFTAPAGLGIDFSKYMSVEGIKQAQSQTTNLGKSFAIITQRSRGSNDNAAINKMFGQLAEVQKNQTISKITLNGMEGMAITRGGNLPPGMTSNQFSFGRGPQVWAVEGKGGDKKDLVKVMKTFEPR